MPHVVAWKRPPSYAVQKKSDSSFSRPGLDVGIYDNLVWLTGILVSITKYALEFDDVVGMQQDTACSDL